MYKTGTCHLGRDCLIQIIRHFQISEMYIPYYLCDVIRHTLVKEKCKPLFYHINDDFSPSLKLNSDKFILYPNYFGICKKNITKLLKIYPKLIIDNAHSYFDEPRGIAFFNAGHKFGYQTSTFGIKENGQEFQNFLYDEARKTLYKEKFSALHKKYLCINKLTIPNDAISFVYPLLCESENMADDIVKQLKKDGKTVYRYWNPLPKSFNEYKFYSKLVPIFVLP